MYRPTGDGKVDIFLDIPSARVIGALLYNFDFDDYDHLVTLKPRFTDFLDKRIVPLAESDSGYIWMQGSASKIGENPWNMRLSQNRVVQTAAYLTSQGIDPRQMQLDAIGEEQAALHALDDERDRAVKLWVFPKVKSDPPPPPPPRRVPKPLVSRNFKLCMMEGLAAAKAIKFKKYLNLKNRLLSRGLIFDIYFFTMWDTTNNLGCYYVYFAIGLGFGAAKLPSLSGTLRGPWNSFTTEKPIHCWQFGKWSRFTTAGAGNWTVNWITIETPKGVDNVYLKIDTGTTLGAGAGSSVGDFVMIEGPFRFQGP